MEQEEIIKGNRAIAEFMGGYERDMGHGDMIWDHAHYMSPLICKTDFDLQYHSSWDWLLPALKMAKQKIKEAGWGTPMEKEAYMRLKAALNEVSNINMEAAHFCFVKFITWYNANKS